MKSKLVIGKITAPKLGAAKMFGPKMPAATKGPAMLAPKSMKGLEAGMAKGADYKAKPIKIGKRDGGY